MKTMTRFSAALAVLLLALALPSSGLAQPWDRPRFHDIKVQKQTLERPAQVRDEKGQIREYREAFVVRLAGKLPPPRDMALEIFIGDWRVPEYRGDAEGLIFHIYEPELLGRLKGKPLSYRLGPEPLSPIGLKLP